MAAPLPGDNAARGNAAAMAGAAEAEELGKMKTQKIQQDEELQHLKSQMAHPKFFLSAPKRDDGQSSRLLSKTPTSCQELKNNNGLWPMDGIHLLKKSNKIQAAFCTFAADGSPGNFLFMLSFFFLNSGVFYDYDCFDKL